MCAYSLNEIARRAENVLANLDHHARCGAVFHDMSGKLNPITGKAFCRLCKACVAHGKAGPFCRQAAISGAYKSLVMGDGFHFNCWLGLRAIVLPISPDGREIAGAIEIGGILLRGELQEKQHQIMSILSSIGADDNLQHFMNAFQGIDELPEINLELLNQFTKEALFSSGLLNTKKFTENTASWQQQQRIAENISTLKPRKSNLKKQIISLVGQIAGDLKQGMKESEIISKTDELISLLILDTKNDVSKIKAYSLVILSVLSADTILRGGKWSKSIPVHTMRMEELEKFTDSRQICFWIENLFKRYLKTDETNFGDHTLSSKVLECLLKNYGDKISVNNIAKNVGASPSSVMHKLKAETGFTFTESLNAVRVKEAKRLLAFTSLPMGEISIRCGFRDQSYFTKIFKKQVNIGPREFRKMLSSESLA